MRENKSYWSDFAAKCREELLGNVMPFWMKYGWDRKNGGVYTCLGRDGSLMDSTKSVWFQGRFGWMTSKLIVKSEELRVGGVGFKKERAEWLEASKSCCEFLEKHCFDRDGRAFFEVTAEGVGLRKRRIDLYSYAHAFALLFQKSIRGWSESEADIADHVEHRNIQAYHQYVAKFKDGEDECYVRFTVREGRGGKSARNEVHSSTVSRIVAYKAKGAELSGLGHAQVEDSTPFVDNKIALFLGVVNWESSPWWKFW